MVHYLIAFLISTSAFASFDVPDGSIITRKIADSAVTTAKIGSTAVTTAKIASGAITQTQMATSSVGTTNIIAGTIVGSNLSSSINLPGTNVKAENRGVIVSNTNSAGSTDMSIFRAAITAAGNASQGEGYPASGLKTGTGTYLIALTTIFSNVPVVVASCTAGSEGYATASSDASSITIHTFNTSGVATDRDFQVIAIGPR